MRKKILKQIMQLIVGFIMIPFLTGCWIKMEPHRQIWSLKTLPAISERYRAELRAGEMPHTIEFTAKTGINGKTYRLKGSLHWIDQQHYVLKVVAALGIPVAELTRTPEGINLTIHRPNVSVYEAENEQALFEQFGAEYFADPADLIALLLGLFPDNAKLPTGAMRLIRCSAKHCFYGFDDMLGNVKIAVRYDPQIRTDTEGRAVRLLPNQITIQHRASTKEDADQTLATFEVELTLRTVSSPASRFKQLESAYLQ